MFKSPGGKGEDLVNVEYPVNVEYLVNVEYVSGKCGVSG